MAKKRVTQGRVIKEDPSPPAPEEKKKGRYEFSIWMWLIMGIITGMLLRVVTGLFTSR